jgi:hypothetical protein
MLEWDRPFRHSYLFQRHFGRIYSQLPHLRFGFSQQTITGYIRERSDDHHSGVNGVSNFARLFSGETVERDDDNNNRLNFGHLESRTITGRYRDEASGSWIFRHRGPSFDSIRPLLDHTDNNTDPIPTSFWVSTSSSHTSP